MSKIMERYLFIFSLLLFPSPLFAQSSDDAANEVFTPPDKLMISPGGVDLRSGKYQPPSPDLPGGGTLSLQRTLPIGVPGHANPFGNYTFNYEVMVTERKYDSTKSDPNIPGDDFRMGVRFGPISSSFDRKAGSDLSYNSTSREPAGTLTGGNGPLTYTARDGTVVNFRALSTNECSTFYRCAFASDVTYPDGNKLVFAYGNMPSGTNKVVLKSVRDSRGFAMVFDYIAIGGQNVVAKACTLNLTNGSLPSSCSGQTDQVATYTYAVVDSEVKLASVLWPDQRGEQYSYSGSTSQSFTRVGESQPYMILGLGQWENVEQVDEIIVGSQSFANGESYDYTFLMAPVFNGGPPMIGNSSYVNAAGETYSFERDYPQQPYLESFNGCTEMCFPEDPVNPFTNWRQFEPGPVRIIDPLNRIYGYNYCDRAAFAADGVCLVGPLQDVTSPNGLKTELFYVGAGQVGEYRQIDPSGQLPARSVFQEFACGQNVCREKPTRVTDSNGNVTDREYSPDHGGILKQTGPADANGVRPQTRYTYVQRYAWVKSGSGYVQAANPVWLLATEEYCRTTAASGNNCVGGAADEVVTTYDYGPNSGPNNLFLRGVAVTADGQTLRTCYSHDDYGRVLSETPPMANLATCP